MKRLIPIFITLISLPLSAQDSPTPVKPKPKLVEPKSIAKAPDTSPGTAKSSSTKSRVNSRRVVLPPKNTRPSPTPVPTVRSSPRPPTSSSSSSRSSGRRVVLPPSSGSSATRSSTTSRSGVRPASSGTGTISRNPVVASRPAPAGLQENITIQLKGSTGSGDAVDLALTGIGPIFKSDVTVGEEGSILTHTYSVSPIGPNYLVEFSIGIRFRVLSSNGPNKSIEYRDNIISGKALLKPGKPVTISNNQGKVLTLTVSQP